MIDVINLTSPVRTQLPYISHEEAQVFLKKGWTLSSTYYFSELRDVYLALTMRDFQNITAFTNFCNAIGLPFVRSPWQQRRILEHLNALINFSLVTPDYRLAKRVFERSRIGDPVTEDEKAVFREIYFDYFRFKEIFSWFVDLNPKSRLALVEQLQKADIVHRSKPLFAVSQGGRFYDTFFYDLKDNAETYYLADKTEENDIGEAGGNADLMRFWDLFLKWGTELGVLERFSLRDLGIQTSLHKKILCSFVLQDYPREFNLLEFLSKRWGNARYLYLPEVVFEIARTYRVSVEKSQDMIVSEYRVHKNYLSFERTSEIFIREGEITDRDKILFPKYNGSYISHLVVRK
jgi:hypothetical protein